MPFKSKRQLRGIAAWKVIKQRMEERKEGSGSKSECDGKDTAMEKGRKTKIMDEKEIIAVKTEPNDDGYSFETFSITLKEEPSALETPESQQLETFCSLCLRDRPPNVIFYEFDINDSASFRDTIIDIFKCELPAKKVLICTPCRKLLKLIESFKACCLKAFSWAEQHVQMDQVVLPIPMVVGEDGWFSDENVTAIDGIKETVDKRIKWIEVSGTEVKMEVEEPCVGNEADKRVRECKKCHRKFYGPRSMTAHMVYCKGDADEGLLHKCHICPASFRRQQDLEAHVNMHEGNKAYECRVTCGDRFYGKDQLYRHERVCRKNVGLENEAEDESDQEADTESESEAIDIQECEKCHRRFDGKHSLISHMNQCGNESEARKLQTCEICSISFVTTQMLKAHLNKHKGVKPYRCRKFCKKKFYGAVYRYKHELSCHELEKDIQPVECETCHRFLEGKRGLYLHMKTCRKDKEKGRLLYKCDICLISFSHKIHLESHRNKHLGIKPFECDFNCGRSFIGPLHLNKHKKCCPKRPAHMRVKPTEKETETDAEISEDPGINMEVIPCENCDRMFDSRGGLISHLRRCKPGNTKGEDDQLMYKCHICPVSFTRKPLLQAHIDRHNGIKHFACGRCGLKFFNLKPKNKHEKDCQVHRCVTCKLEFPALKSLVDHVKEAHGDGKLSCETCGKQFYRRFNFLQHQKKKHPEKWTEGSTEEAI